MLGLPKEYKKKKRISKKLFIPKEYNLTIKRRVQESIHKANLLGQIQGESIPSIVNDMHNVSVIMILNIDIDDLKNANFINSILQEKIKPFAIIRYNDNKGNTALGFGYKRLSKVDSQEIVLENHFVTDSFKESLFDEINELLKKHIHYDNIKNTTNKLSFYSEIMVKAYIISNRNLWSKWLTIIKSNIWYNHTSTIRLYKVFNEIKNIKNNQKNVNNTLDNIKLNKQIMNLYKDLEEIING